MNRKKSNLIGHRFGKLLVTGEAPSRKYPNGGRATLWVCHCDCGVDKLVRAQDLCRGTAISCGCSQREGARKQMTIHGKLGTPEYRLWVSARERHRQKNIPFDLEIENIYIPDKCPVLDIPLKPGQKHHHDASPSLDRLDPSKGYTSDNIIVMSFRANALKRDASLTELQKVLTYLEQGPPDEALVKHVPLIDLNTDGNLVGQRFGSLIVEVQEKRRCVCHCDCGGTLVTYASQLQMRRSCGECPPNRSTHGESALKGRGTDRYELWRGAKQRAEQKQIPFDLDLRGIHIPQVCPVLGIPLSVNVGGKTGAPGSPSLDRYDPHKGYIVGNTVVISHRANLLKSDATLSEWRALVSWAIENMKEIK